MIEDKLPLNEETEKFKNAVRGFIWNHNNRTTIFLFLPLMLYLIKEKVLKIVNCDKKSDKTYILAKQNGQVLLIENKGLNPIVKASLTYLEIHLSDFQKANTVNRIFDTAKILLSLSENWYKKNTIIGFQYICDCLPSTRDSNLWGIKQPRELTKLVEILLDANEGSIYNPYAGRGGFIDLLKDGMVYWGQEESTSSYIAQLYLLLKGINNASFEKNNPSTDWKGYDYYFDYIISNLALADRQEFEYEEIDLEDENILINFLIRSSRDARIKSIGVYPDSICSPNTTEEQEAINMLLEQDVVETIVQLPHQWFDISTTLVIIVTNKKKLRQGFVHLIDARNCYDESIYNTNLDLTSIIEMLNNNESQLNHRYINNEELIKNNNILPSRYINTTNFEVPIGFQQIQLKEILTPCFQQNTLIPEGFLLTNVKDINNRILDIKDIPYRKKIIGPVKVINQDFFVVHFALGFQTSYIRTYDTPILVRPYHRVFYLDTTKVIASYLMTETCKEYFINQLRSFQLGGMLKYRITSEQFLKLKILIPEKFEDQIALSLEAGNKDLKEHWELLDKKYEKKLEDFVIGQRQRKHAVGQVLNELSPAVEIVKEFIEKNDGFGPNSIVGKKYNITLMQYIESIHEQLNKIIKMVDNFTTKEKYSDAETIPINGFLTDYCNHRVVTDKYRITLYTADELDWTDSTPEDEEDVTFNVKFGRNELSQILDNLITNAHKHGFTNPDYKNYEIRISTEVVIEDTPMILLKVANNGAPVSDTIKIEQLFTWGGKGGKSQGTGLGCWQAKDIAEHYDGTLEYHEHPEDENGFICEFIISLPLNFE